MELFRRVLIAITIFTLASPALADRQARVFKTGKRKVLIAQSGRFDVRSRRKVLILDEQKKEIRIDADGDGFAEELEVETDTYRIRASLPFRGHYTNLEFTRREAKGLRTLHLVLLADRRTYRVTRQEFETYGVRFSQKDVQFGEFCADTADDLLGKNVRAWRKQIQEIQAGDAKANEAAMIKRLLDPKDGIIDPSCKGNQFKGAAKDIARATAKIMLSHQKSDPAGFLKCLEQNDLGLHAANIEAAFFEATFAGSKPLITCVPWADPTVNSTYSAKKKQISLHQPKYQPHQCPGGDPANVYAENLLHEMLHLSGIRDEGLVRKMQTCCGRDMKPEATSCKEMNDILSEEKLLRAFNSVYFARFQGRYPALYKRLTETDLETTRGTDMLDQYFKGMNKTLEKADKVRSDCGDTAECDKSYLESVQKYNDRFFAKKCASYFPQRGKAARENCASYRDSIDGMAVTAADYRAIYANAKEIASGTTNANKNVAPFHSGSDSSVFSIGDVSATNENLARESTNVPVDLGTTLAPQPPQPFQPSQSPQPAAPQAATVPADDWMPVPAQETAQSTTPVFDVPSETSNDSGTPVHTTPVHTTPVNFDNPEGVKLALEQSSARSTVLVDAAEQALKRAAELVLPQASAATHSGPAKTGEPELKVDLPDLFFSNPFLPPSPLIPTKTAGEDPTSSREEKARANSTGAPMAENGAGPNRAPATRSSEPGARNTASGKSKKMDNPISSSSPAADPGFSSDIEIPVQWRAQENFVQFLSGKYKNVRPRVGRKEFKDALRIHSIQIKDDRGRCLGPVDALVHFEYSRAKGGLVSTSGLKCQ